MIIVQSVLFPKGSILIRQDIHHCYVCVPVISICPLKFPVCLKSEWWHAPGGHLASTSGRLSKWEASIECNQPIRRQDLRHVTRDSWSPGNYGWLLSSDLVGAQLTSLQNIFLLSETELFPHKYLN